MDIISTGSAVLNMISTLGNIASEVTSLATGSSSLSGHAPATK